MRSRWKIACHITSHQGSQGFCLYPLELLAATVCNMQPGSYLLQELYDKAGVGPRSADPLRLLKHGGEINLSTVDKTFVPGVMTNDFD